MKPLPPGWTLDSLLENAKASMFGMGGEAVCTECGTSHQGLEPDVTDYHCDECGADAVQGAEELLIPYAAQDGGATTAKDGGDHAN